MSFGFTLWYANSTPKPWRVKTPEGKVFKCDHADVSKAFTSFKDAGHTDLPNGPRGVIHADHVQMIGAEELSGT